MKRTRLIQRHRASVTRLALLALFCILGCGDDATAPRDEPLGPRSFARMLAGVNSDFYADAAVTPDGIRAVTGSFETLSRIVDEHEIALDTLTATDGLQDAVVSAFAPDGTLLWSRVLGGSGYETGFCITASPSGRIVMGGNYRGDTDVAGTHLDAMGLEDLLFVSLDAQGVPEWVLGGGGVSFEFVHGLASVPDGSVLACGEFWSSFVLGGEFLGDASDDRGGYLVKISSLGGVVWAVSMTGHGNAGAAAVTVDEAGLAYVAGVFNEEVHLGDLTLSLPGVHALIAQFDPSGRAVWAKSIGGTGSSGLTGITLTSDGMLVFGNFTGGLDFVPGSADDLTSVGATNTSIFAAAYDRSGGFRWAKSFGNATPCFPNDASVAESGGAYFAGFFQGVLSLGGTQMTSYGQRDLFVARIDESGNVTWADHYGSSTDDLIVAVAGTGSGPLVAGSVSGDVALGGGLILRGEAASDAFVYQP